MHLGGSLGTDPGFGRKLRGLKVTAAGLTDYVERLLRNYQADRADGEQFATWVRRADAELLTQTGQPTETRQPTEIGQPTETGQLATCRQPAKAGQLARAGRRMTGERQVPFFCPYCGEENLRPGRRGRRRLGVPRLRARASA